MPVFFDEFPKLPGPQLALGRLEVFDINIFSLKQTFPFSIQLKGCYTSTENAADRKNSSLPLWVNALIEVCPHCFVSTLTDSHYGEHP